MQLTLTPLKSIYRQSMTTQVNSENITLSENKLDTKSSENVHNRQIHRDGNQTTSVQALRRGSHEVCLPKVQGFFGVMKMK